MATSAGGLADAAGDLDAAQVRQVDVQDQDVEAEVADQADGLLAVSPTPATSMPSAAARQARTIWWSSTMTTRITAFSGCMRSRRIGDVRAEPPSDRAQDHHVVELMETFPGTSPGRERRRPCFLREL